MIFRKILASLLVFLFINVTGGLLIIQSFASSYLAKNSLIKKIIPKSYDAVIGVVAEQISDGKEISVNVEELKRIIEVGEYNDIALAAFEPVFNLYFPLTKEKSVIDFSLLKNKIIFYAPLIADRLKPCTSSEEQKDSFQFCKPSSLPNDAFKTDLTNSIKNSIPNNFDLIKMAEDSSDDVLRGLNTLYKVIRFLWAFVLVFSIVVLAIISLLIYSPINAVLSWIGRTFIYLALFLVFFWLPLTRLDLIFASQNISPQKIKLAEFIFEFPIKNMEVYTLFLIITGILIILLGYFLKRKKTQ